MHHHTLFAEHETMELHEMIKSLTVEIKMLQQFSHIAKEPQTKSHIVNCINTKQNQLGELEQFIKAHGIIQ